MEMIFVFCFSAVNSSQDYQKVDYFFSYTQVLYCFTVLYCFIKETSHNRLESMLCCFWYIPFFRLKRHILSLHDNLHLK